ncbi:DMSO/TMAO reductase YedYZ molybdopterin-dependent catalytic subunit [Actinomadura pelletieri DSM 43383]|uniref:DMSO/TMAO reductase YedYZ molybdopterin-dependent catalytic subunit n=1 Tax=Actinomadura pelletieri DSM 43383 TaxID=1120940 RepID=A0A495QUD6_9ACTN|nr:sulfite oxidase [Actinomadura pelletieri]RKS77152.1 DMSO/TMAO reductase YedYZ molybdopterin-dependent catalytic subunit [Actinomadura pelletieri DSM 43383]
MDEDESTTEAHYDRTRMRQWLASGDVRDRRNLLRALAFTGGAAATWHATGHWTRPGAAQASTRPVSGDGPIVKPLPPELFVVHGSNAEMRWEAMRGQGLYVPNDRFFVRNHTRTPRIDVRTWRLRLYGTGLRGAPSAERPVTFRYEDLRRLPAVTVSAAVECAGNGRSFFGVQQGRPAEGTPWRLGGVGVARWRGVRLATVLERAGLLRSAVDVLPQGLDPNVVSGGVDLGHVRRPLPVAKALKDVLLVYEMNGETLPPDHGFPVRLLVPGWVGIASVKWLGSIEVADHPLFSPWNTQTYRFFGPDYPPEGSAPLTGQVAKSAFELPWPATVRAGRPLVLRGRSWAPGRHVQKVEVSTDGGATWRHARLLGKERGWRRWEIAWHPRRTGPTTLLARVTDSAGTVQPERTTFNTFGYLFGAVVRHPVHVVEDV